MATPSKPPEARVGRASRGCGGALARLWNWIRLPAVERFRCCASCGERLESDSDYRRGIPRSGERFCQGARGDGRCLVLVSRYG